LQNSRKIAIQFLNEEKYRQTICYPTYTTEEFKQRLKELEKLKISAIEFIGQKQVHSLPVLGKGCVGIVVIAYRNNEKVALKIRQADANRSTMQHEAHMLKKANEIGIGPCLLRTTRNFLLMEYIEGDLLPEWINTLEGKNARERLCHVSRLILEQAWKLDNIGLDHGELSHAPKHIIIKPNDVPCLVDFETASISRAVSNVTSLCQYLFIGSSLAKLVQRKLGDINKETLVEVLRAYKKKRGEESFKEILKMCKVLEGTLYGMDSNT